MIWELDSDFIERNMRGGDGGKFRDFISDLIHEGCRDLLQITLADISICKKNVADGGIDAQIDKADSSDPSGYFRYPTVWQFKAERSNGPKKYREEITKPNHEPLREKLKDNYRYCFCLCHELDTKDFTKAFEEEIRQINPKAPKPIVLTPSKLAEWANLFLPIIIKHKYSGQQDFLHPPEHLKNLCKAIPQYKEIEEWSPIKSELSYFINFDNSVDSNVFSITGDAGVGKTRFVLECIKSSNKENQSIYCSSNTESLNFLRQFKNNCIIVVDECVNSDLVKLKENFRGYPNFRFVAIDNIGLRDYRRGQNRLPKMSESDLEDILEINFSEVPPNDRRYAVVISKGFPKISADFCKHYKSKDNAFISLQEYYRYRIKDKERRKALEAVSLLFRVGYREELAGELERLADMLGMKPEEIRENFKSLKNAPGFAAIGGRYFYVTPLAVAEIAFKEAWKRWAEDNPKHFFDKILKHGFWDSFMKRLEKVNSDQIRESVAKESESFVDGLESKDLVSKKKIARLIQLIEVSPEKYLVSLRSLVEEANNTELGMGATGNPPFDNAYSPRRETVWLLERLVCFPEFFEDAEAILFRLSLNETEHYANNASSLYLSLFQVVSAGTAVPYSDRWPILKGRVASQNQEESTMTIKAMVNVFKIRSFWKAPPAIVAGRQTPRHWQPEFNDEIFQYGRQVFRFLLDAISKSPEWRQEVIVEHLSNHFRTQLNWGLLDEVRQLYEFKQFRLKIQSKLTNSIEAFLRWDGKGFDEAEIKKLESWKDSILQEGDFRSKMTVFFGRSPLSVEFEEKKKEARKIAQDLYENFDLFKKEIAWLCSADKIVPTELPIELGRLDREAALIEEIFAATKDSFEFLYNYLGSLFKHNSENMKKAERLLDEIERDSPERLFFILEWLIGWPLVYERLIRVCDEGLLDKKLFFRMAGKRIYNRRQILELTDRVLKLAEGECKEEALSCLISLFTGYFFSWQDEAESRVTTDFCLRCLPYLYEFVEAYDGLGYEEASFIQPLYKILPKETVKLCIVALAKDGFNEELKKNIANIAKDNPEETWNIFGQVIISKESEKDYETYQILRIQGFLFILEAVNENIILEWCRKNEKGAERIAHSLKKPYLDENKNPIVPSLTEKVLNEFSYQENVANEFLSGAMVWVKSLSIKNFKGNIERARAFLKYPLETIRKWANMEIKTNERDLKLFKQRKEEDGIS